MRNRALVLGCLLAVASGCTTGADDSPGWVPALEETGFAYLEETAGRTEAAVAAAREHLGRGEGPQAEAALAEAAGHLASLLGFEIPMTEVRQLVYDAQRLHVLGRESERDARLESAGRILGSVVHDGNPDVQAVVENLQVDLDRLRLLLGEDGRQDPARVAGEFQEIAHRVNLLVLKSDLFLDAAEAGRSGGAGD